LSVPHLNIRSLLKPRMGLTLSRTICRLNAINSTGPNRTKLIEDYPNLDYYAVFLDITVRESKTTFRRHTLPPSSGSKIKPSKKATIIRRHAELNSLLLRAYFLLAWTDFHLTTRRYIPEVVTPRNHRCEKIK
jgi:hypothetical protein